MVGNPKGPRTAGKDFNFFDRVTVTGTSFQNEADCIFAIRNGYINFSMINEGGTTVEYSFNGNTVHGDMVSGTPSEALSFSGRAVSKIWFKVASGSSDVRVEAWSE